MKLMSRFFCAAIVLFIALTPVSAHASLVASEPFSLVFSIDEVTEAKEVVGYEGFAERVVIPDGVTGIAEGSLEGCGMTSVVLPASLVEIGGDAFRDCVNLRTIEFAGQSSLETIGESAFSGTSLESFVVPRGLVSGAGAFHSSSIKAVSFESGIRVIPDDLFWSASVFEVSFPDTLEEIGEGAFRNSSGLVSVDLPEGLVRLGDISFLGCSDLESVSIPSSLKEVVGYIPGDGGHVCNPFGACPKLRTVTFGEGITSIPACLLVNTSLESLVIPDTVNAIEEVAVFDCPSLTDVYISAGTTQIGGQNFRTSVGIENRVTIHCQQDSAAHRYAMSNNIPVEFDYVHATHDFGEWMTVIQQTCESDGLERRVCPCGAVEERVLAALGHSFGEWVVDSDATYLSEGLRHHTCLNCSKTFTEVIPQREPDYEAHPDYSLLTLRVVNATSLEAISGARIALQRGEDETVLLTESDGRARAFLPEGTYQVVVEKSGFQARGFECILTRGERTLPDIGISTTSLVEGELTVTEMSREEIAGAGIDTDSVGNQQVFRYETSVKFDDGVNYYEVPSVTYKTEEGAVVGGYFGDQSNSVGQSGAVDEHTETDSSGGRTTFVRVNEYLYLVVQGESRWLKELFHVSLLVTNVSLTDDMNDCVASLKLPAGLSLADMKEDDQSAEREVGVVARGSSASTDWYVRGDLPGDYTLSAELRGAWSSFGDSFTYNFTTTSPLRVYAGDGLNLTVHLADAAFYQMPYTMLFELENVSGKTLYGVTHHISSISQNEVTRYAWVEGGREVGSEEDWETISWEDVGAEGTVYKEEFAPGEKLCVLVKTDILWRSDFVQLIQGLDIARPFVKVAGIVFPELASLNTLYSLLSYISPRYYLTGVMTSTLEGSTAEIPVTYDIEHVGGISITDKAVEKLLQKFVGEGTKVVLGNSAGQVFDVTRSVYKAVDTVVEINTGDSDTQCTAWVEGADGSSNVISISADGASVDSDGRLVFSGSTEISVRALNSGSAYLVVQDEDGNIARKQFSVSERFPGERYLAGTAFDPFGMQDLLLPPGTRATDGWLQVIHELGYLAYWNEAEVVAGDALSTGVLLRNDQTGDEAHIVVPGDANGDARVNLFDAMTMLGATGEQTELSDSQRQAANCVADESIDSSDAKYLLDYLTDSDVDSPDVGLLADGTGEMLDISVADVLKSVVGSTGGIRGVQLDIYGVEEGGAEVLSVSSDAAGDYSRASYNPDADYVRAVVASFASEIDGSGSIFIECGDADALSELSAHVLVQTADGQLEKDVPLTELVYFQQEESGGSQGGSGGSSVPEGSDGPDESVGIDAGAGGSASVITPDAGTGELVIIGVAPEEGFKVADVIVTDGIGRPIEVSIDEDGNWSFVMPEGGVSVEVSFTCASGEACLTHGFSDVQVDAWYHDAVDWAIGHKVFSGYGSGGKTFGPLNAITRAEVAQVLWNQAGRPEAGVVPDFSDVVSGSWYADALSWCLGQGIFRGYGDTFGTECAISREEVATVLWRLSGESEVDSDLSSFSDAVQVSDYARGALAWAVESGVVTGKDDATVLDPQGPCTRAEAAAMLMRLSAE